MPPRALAPDVLCRELDSDSDDNKSASEDPLADIPMTNFAEMDYAGNEVCPACMPYVFSLISQAFCRAGSNQHHMK